MIDGSERGVAYNFWLRVRTEQAERGWNDLELQSQSGIPRGTVDRLKKGKRPPQPRVVNALADALGIDRGEAHRLARLLPGSAQPGEVSVREAIMRDSTYTPKQRETMLQVVDLIEQANRAANPGPDASDPEAQAG
jgi:transcriptional regulator with XRE-family HTH domain